MEGEYYLEEGGEGEGEREGEREGGKEGEGREEEIEEEIERKKKLTEREMERRERVNQKRIDFWNVSEESQWDTETDVEKLRELLKQERKLRIEAEEREKAMCVMVRVVRQKK